MRWGGVDVGGRRKGFHAAVVDEEQLLDLAALPTPEDAAAWLLQREPTVVAVDSPRAPAPEGHTSRPGERELVRARVCQIRWTPDAASLAGNPTYYEWIEHGFELYAACEAIGIRTIECFPTASWSRWAGPRGKRNRADWTSEALAQHSLRGLPQRLSQDDRDAVGAALTAQAYGLGLTENFGEIVVPVGPITSALTDVIDGTEIVSVKRDIERGRAVAAKLRKLGLAEGTLVKAAEQGYITELACKMPRCYCPAELGGATYFDPVTDALSDWMPTLEHFPVPKREGGRNAVDNSVLAHRLCNRLDYSIAAGRSHKKDLERIRQAREAAIRRNNERS